MSRSSTTGRLLPLLLLLCIFVVQGAHSLRCFSCKDTGNGACTDGRVQAVQCPQAGDVCVQTHTTVNISFTSMSVLTKGCGSNATSKSPFIYDERPAFAVVTEFEACATDFCNARKFNAPDFPLAHMTLDNSPLNTSVQCYTCLGITAEQCTDLNSKQTCYGEACAEGFMQMKLRNEEFLTVLFKDCGRWGRFHSLTLNGQAKLGVEIRRVTCTGSLCNLNATQPLAGGSTPRATRPPGGGSTALTTSPLLLALLLAAVLL